MKTNAICVAAVAGLLLIGGPAKAVEYEITIEVDETTNGDMDMVESFLDTANDDSVPSRSLRRVLMGGVGELAANADKRFDDGGNLLLDDGSVVPFLDDDVLLVRKRRCSKTKADGQCGNATISFFCKRKGASAHRKCQPESVQVCPAAGGSISVNVPPARSKGGVQVCTPGGNMKCRSCVKKK